MKHTYSAGGMVINQSGEILLINEGGSFWGLPKGRQETGESLLETAIREIEEESGMTSIKLIRQLGVYQRHPVKSGLEDRSELKNITLFLFKTDVTKTFDNIENNQAEWFNLEEATKLLSHPKDREFLELNIDSIRAAVNQD